MTQSCVLQRACWKWRDHCELSAVTVPLVANARAVIIAADEADAAAQNAAPEDAAAEYLAVMDDLLRPVLCQGLEDLELVESYITNEPLRALASRILTTDVISQCVQHHCLPLHVSCLSLCVSEVAALSCSPGTRC